MSRHMIVTVLLCFMFTSAGCANKLHTVIKEIGYTPIALPSTAYQPGKVVSIVNNDPFQANTVCEYGSYIGSPLAAKDEAASFAASEKLTNTFTLGSDYLRQLNGSADYSAIKEIEVTLTNVSVEEVPDNVVFSGIHSQEAGCTQAIQNIQDRSHIGFLQRALKADATYDVTFDKKANSDISMQQELLRGLAVKLGVQYKQEGKNKIAGNNLYWGVTPPRKDLVLTPLRITELQLLDETFVDRMGATVVTDLHPRSTTSFHYRSADDLLIVFLFTIEDFKVEGNLNIDIDGEILIKDSKGRTLDKTSLPHFSNVHTWEQMPNVKRIGIEKVKKYLNLPAGSIAYIGIIDEFKPNQIPKNGGSIVVSITDNQFKANITKSLPIQFAHD